MPDPALDPTPTAVSGDVDPSAKHRLKVKPTLMEALQEGSTGYRKLWPFVRKYRIRFFASIAAGAGSAILTAGQAQVIRLVTHHAFRENSDPNAIALKALKQATSLAGVKIAAGVGMIAPAHAAIGNMVAESIHAGAEAGAGAGVTAVVSTFFTQPTAQIFLICALLPATIILRGVCDYLENYYMTWVSLRVLHDMRVKLFGHVMSQSLDFFNKAKLGSLISRVSNDTRSAQLAITAVTDDIVTQPLTLIAVVIGMLITDWRFTVYSLCLFPLCLIPIVVYGRKVRKVGRADEACNAELMVILHEALTGIRLVKSLCREPFERDRFTKSSNLMITMSMKVRKAMGIVGPMIEGMAAIGIMMALVYVFLSHMPFSKFVTLLGSLLLLYQPVKKLSKVHVSIQKALAATYKIFELLDTEPTIQDSPGAVKMKTSKGGVEFDNVTFTYDPKRPPAVRNISLRVEPGKSYALVGASGSGKSTMFALMLRFYDPLRGAIRLDGRDIKTLTQESVRKQIGIVSQDTFLFHETIMDNIRYGRLDATDEEVYEAARQAYAHDFILAQPQGYQTIVGDKGCLISGGQQQRLAIARALLKNAPILLLDEATSALDSESEHEIQAALERLATGRTVIAIAHRLSTILKSDQIVVLHQGEIKDIGRHEELLEKSLLYRRLYDLQFNRAEAEEVPFEVAAALAS